MFKDRAVKVLLSTVLGVSSMTAFFALVLALRLVQFAYLPIATHWTILEFKKDTVARTIEISGTMVKHKVYGQFCTYRSVHMEAVGDRTVPAKRVGFDFMDQPKNITENRKPGFQYWGPWRIKMPKDARYKKVNVEVYHYCLFIWPAVTRLGSVSLR